MRILDVDDRIEVRALRIPMPDGVHLHGRLWLPRGTEGASAQPVPALLEYLPYRLDDWTSVRDSERHAWYAAHGYASVRVDIRGTGSSDGVFDDEYSPAELDDGVALVHWLAEQSWCDGSVGMFGISWGGFNALQVAQRAPEPLRAIVTVCSTDDRYDNDVHYVGGAVLGLDMPAWAGTMLAFASRPPRPEVVGAGWVEQWRTRLQHQRPLGPVWLGHQERDGYWRHGSVCEDYSAIRAPVLAVGGWSDPYRDTVLRLVRHLNAPAKGIIGPWSHQYPDRGLAPGPAIGFLQETLRWWDRWLKGVDTGVDGEPALRAWIDEPGPSERPAPFVEERTGRWVGVRDPDGAPTATLSLAPHTLGSPDSPGSERVQVRSPWATGQDSGRFFPFGNAADLPPDQRAEDGRSVCVDLPVGDEPIDLLGRAQATLRLACSHERGHVVVRLCDVAPDGTSRLVSRGVLNLLKRSGMERHEPLEPGVDVEVTVPLVAAGHRFMSGHRIRVAISNHYWPWVWPHAVDDTLDVDLSGCSLRLPQAPPDSEPVRFEDAEHARPLVATALSGGDGEDGDEAGPEREVSHDVATGRTTLVVDPGYGGSRRYPDGLEFREQAREEYSIVEGDPTSPRAESTWRVRLAGADWAAEIHTRSVLTCTESEFVVENAVHAEAVRAGVREVVADQAFSDRVPRTSA